MWCIVGLGNPGIEYTKTRHNVGVEAVSAISGFFRIRNWRKACYSDICSGKIGGEYILLVLPQTYMNASGKAVEAVTSSFDIPIKRFIVVHDDIDLSLGKIRIKWNGGGGGHRGVMSIYDALKTFDFIRIRIGISRPGAKDINHDITEYVLGTFNDSEMTIVRKVVSSMPLIVQCIIIKGLAYTMSAFNNRDLNSEGNGNDVFS